MEKEIISRLHKNFEEYAHEQDGVEFWFARELRGLLGYDEWRNFEGVVNKAKIACEMAQQKDSDHFVGVNKMVDNHFHQLRKMVGMSSNTIREII